MENQSAVGNEQSAENTEAKINPLDKKHTHKTVPIKVKCPACEHVQLSVQGENSHCKEKVIYESYCERCGTKTEFFEHLIAVKKRRRRKEMIPPPLFDKFDQPIIYK